MFSCPLQSEALRDVLVMRLVPPESRSSGGSSEDIHHMVREQKDCHSSIAYIYCRCFVTAAVSVFLKCRYKHTLAHKNAYHPFGNPAWLKQLELLVAKQHLWTHCAKTL